MTTFVLVACSSDKQSTQTSETASSQTVDSSQEASSADDSQKILVAYFFASGNTATIAQDGDFETGGNLLAEMVGTGNWEKEGQRFSSSATNSEVAEWLTDIGY